MLSKSLSFILILGSISGYEGCRPPKRPGDPRLTEEDGWLEEIANLMEEDEALSDSSNSMRQGEGLQGPSNLMGEDAEFQGPSRDLEIELKKRIELYCSENIENCSDNWFCKKVCRKKEDKNEEPHASYQSSTDWDYRDISNSPHDEKITKEKKAPCSEIKHPSAKKRCMVQFQSKRTMYARSKIPALPITNKAIEWIPNLFKLIVKIIILIAKAIKPKVNKYRSIEKMSDVMENSDPPGPSEELLSSECKTCVQEKCRPIHCVINCVDVCEGESILKKWKGLKHLPLEDENSSGEAKSSSIQPPLKKPSNNDGVKKEKMRPPVIERKLNSKSSGMMPYFTSKKK